MQCYAPGSALQPWRQQRTPRSGPSWVVSWPNWASRGPDASTSGGFNGITNRFAHRLNAFQGRPRDNRSGLVYPGEYNFNLSEYAVTLDKPLGLTLAPDPATGRIVVQAVHEGSPAAACRLIQPGDVLKACSAVWGEDLWECRDLQRTRWAINNRVGQVRLVLERSGSRPPVWYLAGKEGIVSSAALVPTQLPVKVGDSVEEELLQEGSPRGLGRPLSAGFTRSSQPPWGASFAPASRSISPSSMSSTSDGGSGASSSGLSAGRRARMARLDALRRALEAARVAGPLQVISPVARMVANKGGTLASQDLQQQLAQGQQQLGQQGGQQQPWQPQQGQGPSPGLSGQQQQQQQTGLGGLGGLGGNGTAAAAGATSWRPLTPSNSRSSTPSNNSSSNNSVGSISANRSSSSSSSTPANSSSIPLSSPGSNTVPPTSTSNNSSSMPLSPPSSNTVPATSSSSISNNNSSSRPVSPPSSNTVPAAVTTTSTSSSKSNSTSSNNISSRPVQAPAVDSSSSSSSTGPATAPAADTSSSSNSSSSSSSELVQAPAGESSTTGESSTSNTTSTSSSSSSSNNNSGTAGRAAAAAAAAVAAAAAGAAAVAADATASATAAAASMAAAAAAAAVAGVAEVQQWAAGAPPQAPAAGAAGVGGSKTAAGTVPSPAPATPPASTAAPPPAGAPPAAVAAVAAAGTVLGGSSSATSSANNSSINNNNNNSSSSGTAAGSSISSAESAAGVASGSSSPGGSGSSGLGGGSVGSNNRTSGSASNPAEKRVLQLLPWLLVATAPLQPQELLRIATQRALGSCLQLSVTLQQSRLALRGAAEPPQSQELGVIGVAAALQRLVVRHRFQEATVAGQGGCNILVIADSPGALSQLGVALTLWLHCYGGLEEKEAISTAENTLGWSIDEALLARVVLTLLQLGRERYSRALLTWPYGGLAAEVSGELVGGWASRVPMMACSTPRGCRGVRQGQFYLEVRGLRPGRYHYKYIVDNTWAVDPFAPKDLDAVGNWNNVIDVFPPPKLETGGDVMRFARYQAALEALGSKLRHQ